MWTKIEKQSNQSEEFINKERRRYNVSVLINHHQDMEKIS